MGPPLAGLFLCVVALLAALPAATASARAVWFRPGDEWTLNSTIGSKTRGYYPGSLQCDEGLELWRLELDTKVPSGDIGGDICGYRNVGCFGYKLAVATGTPIQPVVFKDKLLAGSIRSLRATFMGVHYTHDISMNVGLNEHVVETKNPTDGWGGCTWTTGVNLTAGDTDFSWYKFDEENVMNLFWDPSGPDYLYSCISNVLVEFCVDRQACLPGEKLLSDRTGCAECPVGKYSEVEMASSCTSCPEGTYGNTIGLPSEACSGKCPKGHYCPEGSTDPTAHPCPAGTYGGEEGLETPSCSGSCSEGHYCPEGSTSPTPHKCPAGTYGSEGAKTSDCDGNCVAGYFCPEGSASPIAEECGSPDKYCPSGSPSPTNVSAGHYSTGGLGPSTRSGQVPCQLGHFCVDGMMEPCPPGRASLRRGAESCAAVGNLTVSNVVPGLHATTGGQWVNLTGTRMGGDPSPDPTTNISVVYGPESDPKRYEAQNCSIPPNQNEQVECRTVPGTGGDLVWTVRVEAETATSTVTTSYHPPSLRRLEGADSVSTAGGDTLWLYGDDFGPAGSALELETTGGTLAATACRVLNHTAATCTAAEGVGANIGLVLAVDGVRNSSLGDAFTLSYAPPVITAATTPVRPMATEGGDPILVNGTNLGSSAATLELRYSGVPGYKFLAADCEVEEAHVAFRCKAAPGWGGEANWTLAVTVGGQRSDNFSMETGYRRPQLLRVSGPGAHGARTEGGETVELRGTSFGPAVGANNVTARYGPPGDLKWTAENCRVVLDQTVVECKTASGVGGNHSWVLHLGLQESPVLAAGTSYAPPVITRFSGAGGEDADTEGGQTVVIHGRNFGKYGGEIDQVLYGPEDGPRLSARGCGIAEPFEQIRCFTAAGAGDNLAWSVVISGQESVSPTTSYAPPAITAIEGGPGVDVAALSTAGNQTVMLRGRNFGPPAATYLQDVTYGDGSLYTARACSVLDHTRIRCLTAPGTGGGFSWQVVVEGQEGHSGALTTSYSPPNVTLVAAEGLTSAGGTLRMEGRDLGVQHVQSVVKLRIGPGHGQESVERRPSSREPLGGGREALEFRLPPGSGTRVPVTLLVGPPDLNSAAQASQTMDLSFGVPQINKVQTFTTQTSGETEVRLVGRNFGLQGTLYINDEATVPSAYGHTEVRATFMGQKGTARIEVDPSAFALDSGPLATNNVSFIRYSPLVVSSAVKGGAEEESSGKLRTAGGSLLVLTGEHFGESEDVNVTVGGRTCELLNVTDTRIECTAPPGDGRDVPVAIIRSATAPASSDFTVSYLPPAVDSIEPASVPTDGGIISIEGSNLGTGRPGHFSVVLLAPPASDDGDTPALSCNVSSWSHDVVKCTVAPGAGTGWRLRLGAGPTDTPREQVVTVAEDDADKLLAFAAPSIASVEPPTGPTVGFALTVKGSNLGPPAATFRPQPVVAVGEGPIPCHDLEVVSSSQLRCRVGEGAGIDLAVRVDVAGQTATGVGMEVGFDPPSVTDMFPRKAPTVGGVLLTLLGSNFGPAAVDPSPAEITVDFAPLSSRRRRLLQSAGFRAPVVRKNHTQVQVLMPAGTGADLVPRVTVREDSSSTAASSVPTFSYSPPRVTSVSPEEGSPDEEKLQLTIKGENFGDDRKASVKVEVGADRCVIGDEEGAYDHERILCQLSAGFGRDLPVVVTTAGQVSNDNVTFSYLAPAVIRVSPQPFNASAETLEVYGENFGRTPSFTELLLEDQGEWKPCSDPTFSLLEAEGGARLGRIVCTTPAFTVGAKKAVLRVARQSVNVSDQSPSPLFLAECKTGFYGRRGEFCTPCPEGGACVRPNTSMPVSEPGWWNDPLVVPNAECDPRNNDPELRQLCPMLLPCEPKSSCTGDNTCLEGYAGIRCGECADGYYRLSGRCTECPDNPWLIVVGMLVTAVTLATSGYYLNRKHVNLSFMSIGIDYVQILAMFAQSHVGWPASVRWIFNILSVFNFNLELTAPECSIPNFTYGLKWALIETMPLMVVVLFTAAYVVFYFHKRVIKRRREHLHSHAPDLLGAAMLLFYFMYLFVTRTTLDIFNCNPTDPPDGKLYLEAVFVPCYVEGGLHMRLLPWAWLALVCYVAGYPLLVLTLLYRNRFRIQEDQILRAKDLGFDRGTNPNCYDLRRRFSKLYFHFKPDYWFWVLLIVTRKFFVAFTALMFRKNPSFQLAMALLVMFASYVLQVKYRPYMSMSERNDVVKEFERRLEGGDTRWKAVNEVVRLAEDNAKRRGARKKRLTFDPASSTQSTLMRRRLAAQRFFFNYNTVEAVLLACSVLINLAGIMFESGRLDTKSQRVQREFLTILVILVIVASFVYFFMVFMSEICTTFYPQGFFKQRIKKTPVARHTSSRSAIRAAFSEAEKGATPTGAGDSKQAFFSSPMFFKNEAESSVEKEARSVKEMTESEKPPGESGWQVWRAEYMRLQRANMALVDELKNTKKKFQQTVVKEDQPRPTVTGPQRRPRRSVAKRRKEFGQAAVGAASGASAVELAKLTSSPPRGGASPAGAGARAPAEGVGTPGTEAGSAARGLEFYSGQGSSSQLLRGRRNSANLVHAAAAAAAAKGEKDSSPV